MLSEWLSILSLSMLFHIVGGGWSAHLCTITTSAGVRLFWALTTACTSARSCVDPQAYGGGGWNSSGEVRMKVLASPSIGPIGLVPAHLQRPEGMVPSHTASDPSVMAYATIFFPTSCPISEPLVTCPWL